MGKNVDMGGAAKEAPKTEKMIYMNIPTVLAFILECREYPKAKKYTDAMIQSVQSTLSNSELRAQILKTFQQKTVKKLKTTNTAIYVQLREIFGKKVFGE